MKMHKLFTYLLLFSVIGILQAQTTREEFFSDARYAGGLYCPYIKPNAVQTPAPKGYEPFYISHYGRHGSRWVISPDCHIIPQKILGEAYNEGKLTDLGKSLFQRIKLAAEDAADRYGDLSPLGVNEEKQIAERMYKSFPQVFNTKDSHKSFIYSRSTQVPRCILSMAAFNERLKELNPSIKIVSEATKRNSYLNNDGVLNRDTVKTLVSGFLKRHLQADRFLSTIFNDTAYAKQKIDDPGTFMSHVFSAAINLPNLDHLNFSMMDVFNNEEIFVLWQSLNMHMYYLVGPSPINEKTVLKSSSLLLKDILSCAENAIMKKNISADLRFGHDTYIIPLLALMDIKDMNVPESSPEKVYTAWSSFKASPMGTNLQLVFYKNEKSGDILVKLLFCEKEVQIPVTTNLSPYYHWQDIKEYYEKKLLN